MPGEPSQPAKGDWSESKQGIVIGACILSIVIFVIGAILGAGSSSQRSAACWEHGHRYGDCNQDRQSRGDEEAQASRDRNGHGHCAAKVALGQRKETQSRPRNCTPGYSPCLAPASDYDCRGGSGNGPKYTGPIRVTGSDPYDLDRDGDGRACEWS
jgi:hypothetical protein